ncbi:hypothetical protein PISMIDRAFT_672117 [Pisolithus microcarpus 441]|uniref:Uncharacterized protein n=1 Tax=Pisolithus microcarpus 441 TaxID=765257 RepID=A0A0D0ABP5_9AGAM|nr:hypothetical protein PISMIDRAFT_672117 [Pisolithus microcarpus 441]
MCSAHVFGPSRTSGFNDSEQGQGLRQNAKLRPHNPLNFAERVVRLAVRKTGDKDDPEYSFEVA